MTGAGIIGVVGLAVGILDKHGDSIIGFVDKSLGLADRATGAKVQTEALETIVQNQDQLERAIRQSAEIQTEALMIVARSQDQLKRTIKQSTEILGTLIKSESLTVIEKMERDRARNALDDLKASVTAMKAILAENNIDRELAERIITQHLTPVRHYTIKASNILGELEDENLGSCCRIVGLTALVAGYEYLGQDVSGGIKKELGNELLALQKRMLTHYARSLFARGEDLDWEKVPEMLSVKGAETLAERFIETGDTPIEIDDDESEEYPETEVPDPREMYANEAKNAVESISDVQSLLTFTVLELLNPRRRRSVLIACRDMFMGLAVQACDKYAAYCEEEDDEDEDEDEE
ncbi:MAG: hypothetical protein ACOX7Q_11575 [Kiritimatiellia bacterium]|jgi:hypothetical protein